MTYVRGIARISSLERSRNANGRRTRRPTATGNVDLRAADVELRWATRVMDPQLLDTQQVLAVFDALGDVVCIIRCFDCQYTLTKIGRNGDELTPQRP